MYIRHLFWTRNFRYAFGYDFNYYRLFNFLRLYMSLNEFINNLFEHIHLCKICRKDTCAYAHNNSSKVELRECGSARAIIMLA